MCLPNWMDRLYAEHPEVLSMAAEVLQALEGKESLPLAEPERTRVWEFSEYLFGLCDYYQRSSGEAGEGGR